MMLVRGLMCLSGQELGKFEVRCIRIVKTGGVRVPPVKPPSRTNTSVMSVLPTRKTTETMPLVTAAKKGPLVWVTVLDSLLSCGLLISSLAFGDGMSLLATLLLSSLSTLTGVANKCKLRLPRRPQDNAPPGDTVVRYPNGSMLVVRCDEEIARELYFAPEEIEYKLSNPSTYRMISLFGTIILMLGIIVLANAKLQLQFAWAGAYIITNATHWIVAALPPRLHWDLSCYEIDEQGVVGGPHSSNFTEALWKAILLTKETRWVKNGDSALPQTAVWDEWLVEARDHAKLGGKVTGELEDPVFGTPTTRTGTIWTSAPGWQPKQAWSTINEAHEQGRKPEAVPIVTQA